MYGRMVKALWISVVVFLVMLGVVMAAAVVAGGDAIPPMKILYTTTTMEWVIRGRIAFFLSSATALLFLGALMFASGFEHGKFIMKARSWSFGIAMLTTSMMECCFVGLILYGGFWHWAALFAGGMNAISVVSAAIIGFATQERANEILK